jgi:hypothetical protein
MRRKSRSAVSHSLCLAFIMAVTVYAHAGGEPPPACVPSASAGYPGKVCTVTIKRSSPASPTTLTVAAGTTVKIVIKSARPDESISFTPVTTQVAPVDVLGTFIKASSAPLQAIDFRTKAAAAFNFTGAADLTDSTTTPTDVQTALADQKDIAADVLKVLDETSSAASQLACLEAYRGVESKAPGGCSAQVFKTSSEYNKGKNDAIKVFKDAARATLPIALLKAIDTAIDGKVDLTTDADTVTLYNRAMSNQVLLNALVNDVQTTQKTLREAAEVLENLNESAPDASFSMKQAKNYNSTITITAQELVSKATSTLATVTINWQSNPWSISTGFMYSTVPTRSFVNSDIILNGQPSLDPGSGKNLTQVTESDAVTILAPLVMANYRIGPWSRANWENSCPNHCAFLLSGGIGLNPVSKIAEYAVGPSFQFGEVLFSPLAHIGKDTFLTNGVTVGSQLGVGPPDLPIGSSWGVHFGFAISYILPFQ